MKSIFNHFKKTIILGVLALTSWVTKAETTPTTKTFCSQLQKNIREHIKLSPQVIMLSQPLHKNEYRVEILFTTNQTGQVNFALAKTSNSKLKTEIEKQFMTLKIASLKNDVVHSVILNFKTL